MASDEDPQLDLFADSADAIVERELTAALRAGRPGESRERAERLAQLRPDHPRLPDLEILVAGLDYRQVPPVDPGEHLREMEERLAPVAEGRLGRHASAYLAPLWRALADRLADTPFDPARPRLHGSYAALRAGDWREVLVRVEAEEWWRQPVLVSRRLLAKENRGEAGEALADWCRLCWAFPAEARERLAEDTALGRVCRHLPSVDPPWEVADLPAWYALAHGRQIEPPAELAGRPEAVLLETVNPLIAAGPVRGTPDGELLEYRRRLKTRHPRLYELYKAVYTIQ